MELTTDNAKVPHLSTTLPRIIVIAPGSFSIPSDKSSSVERIIENCLPNANKHLHLTLFAPRFSNQPRYETVHGIAFERFKRLKKTTYLSQMAKRIRQLAPDIIQVENRPHFVNILKKYFPHKRLWLQLHSLTYVTPTHISKKQLRRCFNHCERIIVNSYYVKQIISQQFPKMCHRIYVNYPGVDTTIFHPCQSIHEKKSFIQTFYPYKKSPKILLFVGRLRRIKGVHHLLSALPQLVSKYPNVLLVIVGSAYYGKHMKTPYVRELEALARLVPEQHVKFIPFVSHQQVAHWYRMADVLLVPSAKKEAFGLVNIEAMASGLPVIATASGGIPEIIQHGVTGFLIDPLQLQKQLIAYTLQLFNDSDLAKRMGNAGLQRVKQYFSWERMQSQWIRWIKQTYVENMRYSKKENSKI